MILHQLFSNCTKRFVDRRDLRHDVRAVSVVLHHLLKSPHLSFDAPKALQISRFRVGLDVHGFSIM
jgi:hypothetical protein